MATEEIKSENIVDSAIGPVRVVQSTVTGFDVDDFVTSRVQSTAVSVKMYNLAQAVDKDTAKGRRKVSVGGVSVGGYE